MAYPNRIDPAATKELFTRLGLVAEQNVFFADWRACLFGAIYVERFGKDDARDAEDALKEGEITYRNIAFELGLDPDYVQAAVYGWDGFSLSAASMGLDADQAEAGYQDGVAAYANARGW